MSGFRLFASFTRHAAGIRPVTRNTLIAVGVCLAGLGLFITFGDVFGSPTDRDLATALAIGG